MFIINVKGLLMRFKNMNLVPTNLTTFIRLVIFDRSYQFLKLYR